MTKQRLCVVIPLLHDIDASSKSSQVGCLSLHSGQVAHQAGAYPGFHSMKPLGVFLLPPGWDASPLQGYPQH